MSLSKSKGQYSNNCLHFSGVLFHCWNIKIAFSLEICGSQSFNIYWLMFSFSTLLKISHLWNLEKVIFLHRCLIGPVLLNQVPISANRWQHWPWTCFSNFLSKKYGIANNSAITEARAKINTDLKSVEFWKKFWCIFD